MPQDNAFGRLVRFWRMAFDLSQETLAGRLDASPRHISFLENGRATPSRGLVERLAESLDLGRRDAGDLMLAAGYLPRLVASTIESPENDLLRRGLVETLRHQAQAREVWKPFFDWVGARPQDFHMPPPVVNALPAARFWDPTLLKTIPGAVIADDRPHAPEGAIIWAGDAGEAGQFLHGFQSRWLQQALLSDGQRPRLAEALYAATRRWWISLQFNKGLAGAHPDALAAAGDTAINPVALDAFALAVSSAPEARRIRAPSAMSPTWRSPGARRRGDGDGRRLGKRDRRTAAIVGPASVRSVILVFGASTESDFTTRSGP